MNKGTENFKKVIKQHLDEYCLEDVLFIEKYNNPKKNIDDCIKYIITEVHKSGMNGFEDEEIFKMARHYYDEENVEIKDIPNCNIVSNHKVELTPEEIEEAKKKAKEEIMTAEMNRLKSKPTTTPIKKSDSSTNNLRYLDKNENARNKKIYQ